MLLSLCAGSALLSSLGEPGSDLTFSVFSFFSFFAFSVFLSRFLLSFASFSAASSSLDLGGFHFLSMPDEQEYAWAFHTNNPLST